MLDEITVEEFFEEANKKLFAFKERWNKKHEENPDDYPTYLLPGDWDEQFAVFLNLKE